MAVVVGEYECCSVVEYYVIHARSPAAMHYMPCTSRHYQRSVSTDGNARTAWTLQVMLQRPAH